MADGEDDSSPNLSVSLPRQTLIRGKKRKITLHSMVLRRRNSGQADPAEPPTVQTSTPVSSSVSCLQAVPLQTDITDMAARKRYELRRRRSLQQSEGDGCIISNSMVATTDENMTCIRKIAHRSNAIPFLNSNDIIGELSFDIVLYIQCMNSFKLLCTEYVSSSDEKSGYMVYPPI
ncbi:hypothetical protein WUBG_00004 [Wuchereria bancrofti]|uniref:Uncharacterized protein n=1 Tax=Wuchereria bancrofti TaxID=6293 RepID=J9FHI2_WUCBA|nr:hypothetical protein WUBG_00004 [Wuchereria bancrofti]